MSYLDADRRKHMRGCYFFLGLRQAMGLPRESARIFLRVAARGNSRGSPATCPLIGGRYPPFFGLAANARARAFRDRSSTRNARMGNAPEEVMDSIGPLIAGSARYADTKRRHRSVSACMVGKGGTGGQRFA
jgi:hypothetical protein